MKIWPALFLFVGFSPASAATIYLCKSYSGASFWSQAHCSQHRALIDRIESVADVPWDQQVQQAEQGARARADVSNARLDDVQRSSRCAQLEAERQVIEGRYARWQWQPPEVINPDQQRMRGLRAELSANRCSRQ